MQIVNFTPIYSLAGGILIGISAVILMLFNGKIAGISGISKGVISTECPNPHERKWRIYFLTGLIIGGIVIMQFLPSMTSIPVTLSPFKMVIAGLLVGIGTSMGNGCTSGHGVCGLGRRSLRSLASVITFMSAGSVTVFILFHILKIGV
ncbi:MAG: YeeE/YedE family protein [Candidatus Sericytochromatia bacterium]|nr:YeeE/YedE family protein [Candidatus Sericytochromatia bacterium]